MPDQVSGGKHPTRPEHAYTLLMSFWTTRAEQHAKAGDVAALVRLLDGPAEPAHERAAAACSFVALAASFGALRPQVLVSLIRSAVEDQPYIRGQALFALAELRAVEALDAFRRAAADPDWIIRFYGTHGLDRLGDPSAIQDVVLRLDDRESQVREAAVTALASIGDPRVRPLLDRVARSDRYASVREAAAEAIAGLRSR